jgi:hypothetical protein
VRRELLLTVTAAWEFNSADGASSFALGLSVSRLLAKTVVKSELNEAAAAAAAALLMVSADALASSAVGSVCRSLVIFNIVQIAKLGVMQIKFSSPTTNTIHKHKQVFYCSVDGMQ